MRPRARAEAEGWGERAIVVAGGSAEAYSGPPDPPLPDFEETWALVGGRWRSMTAQPAPRCGSRWVGSCRSAPVQLGQGWGGDGLVFACAARAGWGDPIGPHAHPRRPVGPTVGQYPFDVLYADILSMAKTHDYDAEKGTYAIDGHQERVGESIFLFAPSCVTVTNTSHDEASTPTVVSRDVETEQQQDAVSAPSPAWGAAAL